MDNAGNYPSCIKIPPANSRQNATSAMFSQKFDVKDALTLNNELILVANRIFGERKWSHTVTNQTIDFIETFMGKYVCGCVTFVKVQLQDGTFHEDVGYCYAERPIKGLSIHCARIGSFTDAFKKVLSCFGKEIGIEVQKLSKKLPNSYVLNNQKEDFQCSLFNVPTEMLEPCAQSTPLLNRKSDEEKSKTDNVLTSENPNNQKEQQAVHQITKPKSPNAPQEGLSTLDSLKPSNDIKNYLHPSSTNHRKEQDNLQIEQDSRRALTEEEYLRMERKRKQMEKQAEYKKMMKEREQQRANENKNFKPK